MNKQRYLLVVSGPSGAGKDTVVSRMMQKHPEIEISVSPARGARVVAETDISISGCFCIIRLTTVSLPAPDGPETTSR